MDNRSNFKPAQSLWAILAVLMALLASCSPTLAKRDEYISIYQAGDMAFAEERMTKTIENLAADQNFCQSNDAVWLLLDRATARFAQGNTQDAIKDYRLALEAIDYYNQESTLEHLQQVLLEDGFGAYSGEDFEQILARVYFALALLHEDDTGNAFALLRQAEETQQKKREMYAKTEFTDHYKLIDNAIAKYLLALLLDRKGDRSNAEILYGQAASLVGSPSFQKDLSAADQDGKNATVLVICHNGNSPYKISATSNASVASTAALEFILASRRVDPAWSSLTGIPIPQLVQKSSSFPYPTFAAIDGIQKSLIPFYDITKTAYQQLQQKLPVIAARAVARFLIRRGTVAYAKKQDQGMGALADLAMFVANASTQADTRSWSTLPSSIDVARFDLKPGTHLFSAHVQARAYPPLSGRYQIRVAAGDLCVINIFNIHPGITQVVIPKRFLYIDKGESP